MVPWFRAMLRIENLCLAVGFTHEQTAHLMTGKPLPYNGELYSDEHRRKFRTNDVTAKVGTNNGKLILAIDGLHIGNGSRNNLNDYNRMSVGSLFRKRIKASSYSQSCASHTWRTFFVPMYIESKTNSCYSQEITHTVNTPFLLIEIRMNVQIKCRCHI